MMQGGNAADEESWMRCGEGAQIPVLTGHEIHVWRASLDGAADKIKALESLLSPDERARADRFRFPEHRSRFIGARGTLRRILGMCLDCEPAELRFAYGEHGKPALESPVDRRVEFNLSHSGGIALYAVAIERRVGVDVELIKEGKWLRIAAQFFTPEEAAFLGKLPEEAMRKEFFLLWSQKEACLKAIGTGLRFPLEEAENAIPWTIINLNPMPGYAGALAFESMGHDAQIIRHHFAI